MRLASLAPTQGHNGDWRGVFNEIRRLRSLAVPGYPVSRILYVMQGCELLFAPLSDLNYSGVSLLLLL